MNFRNLHKGVFVGGVVAAGLLAWTLPATGQDLPSAIEFVKSEMVLARAFPVLELCEVRLQFMAVGPASADDIERFRRYIAKDPKHPLASQMVEIERTGRMQHLETWTIWAKDETQWRWNTDRLTSPESSFSDIVLSDDGAWMSSSRELAMFDPRRGFPPARDVRTLAGFVAGELSLMMHGGLRKLGAESPDLARSSVDAAVAKIAFGTGDGTVTLDWNQGENRWFAREVSIGAGGSTARYVSTDWWYSPEASVWIARDVTKYGTGGLVVGRLQLESTTAIDQARLEELAAIPDPKKGDVVRGKLPEWASESTIAVIRDYRNEPNTPVSTMAAPANQPLPAALSPHRWRVPLLLGIAAVSLLFAGAVLYSRKKSGDTER